MKISAGKKQLFFLKGSPMMIYILIFWWNQSVVLVLPEVFLSACLLFKRWH